jgi:hypothetical protein
MEALKYRFFFLGIHLMYWGSIGGLLGMLGFMFVNTFPIGNHKKG